MSEIIFGKIEPGIQVRTKVGRKWVEMTHEARLPISSALFVQYNDHLADWRILSGDGFTQELEDWLSAFPYSIHGQGDDIVIQMTEKDMALFRLRFG